MPMRREVSWDFKRRIALEKQQQLLNELSKCEFSKLNDLKDQIYLSKNCVLFLDLPLEFFEEGLDEQ